MNPLSGLDATFLYLEQPNSPMHIGSVSVIDGSLEFERFRALVASRLHLMPKMRQRLIEVPLSIDYPYWADDPNFNINLHLQRIALPSPGGWRELRALASGIFSRPLDRSRPLWEITFVEGLETVTQVPPGSVALIAKIHHAALDGVGGADLMTVLYDLSAESKPIPDPEPFNPAPLPNELNVVTRSAMDFAKNPLKLPRILAQTAVSTVKAGVVSRVQRAELPTVPFTAPPTRLNKVVSAQRKWNAALISLDRVKTLKNALGVTLNDVMLAICAGALRRYLLEKDELPSKSLVAMIPISVRDPSEKGEGGNKVSNMLVQLGTDIADPIERLERIHDNTKRGKLYQMAIGAKALTNLAETVPFGVGNQAARLYSRLNLAERINPVFNVVITNVPGPQRPIYLDGHQLLAHMGTAPIIDGMGLIITIFSYNGVIAISPTSDANSMPDVDLFTRYLRESANNLESLILAMEQTEEGVSDEAVEASAKIKLQSDAIFEGMHAFLQENPEFLKPDAGSFQFDITGDAGESVWHADLTTPPGSVVRGAAPNPDATFIAKDKHFIRIANGELGVQSAFIQGRLKVKGDMQKALKLGAILTKVMEAQKG